MAQDVHCPKQMILGKWRSQPEDRSAELFKLIEDMKAEHTQDIQALKQELEDSREAFAAATAGFKSELSKLHTELRVMRAERQRSLASGKANTPKARATKLQGKDKPQVKPNILPLHSVTPSNATNGSLSSHQRGRARSPAVSRASSGDKITPVSRDSVGKSKKTGVAKTGVAKPRAQLSTSSTKPIPVVKTASIIKSAPRSTPSEAAATAKMSKGNSKDTSSTHTATPTQPVAKEMPRASGSSESAHAHIHTNGNDVTRPATKRTPDSNHSGGAIVAKRERRGSEDSQASSTANPEWDLEAFVVHGSGKLHAFVRSVMEGSSEDAEFRSSGLEPYQVAWIGQAVARSKHIESLALYSNRLRADVAPVLCQYLPSATLLTELDLSNNLLRNKGAATIAQALASGWALSALSLASNQIKSEGAAALAQALHTNTTLSHLILHTNDIGDVGIVSVAEMLKVNTTLKNLDLDRINLNAEGGMTLAEGLRRNTGLEQLDLQNNNLTSEGGMFIAKALADNDHLVELHLIGNGLDDWSKKRLLKSKRDELILEL
eukprot:TRINITY_DN12186_c0_g1_i5.p1 TRINITY_DN12186_c0_g1~~TRINITY_DN12186_c0_g1_i5.p1  ORF type:complete len:549 (+),score=159.54 TRINITY_DN12186_c0_g1_i5:291-1937(+)